VPTTKAPAREYATVEQCAALRRRRLAAEISLDDVSGLIGMESSHISRAERAKGNRRLTLIQLEQAWLACTQLGAPDEPLPEAEVPHG
jgi:transcriptional regulator with XRE-family HTH domain